MTALFFLVLAAVAVYGLHRLTRLTRPTLVPVRIARNDGPEGPAPRNDHDWSGR